MEIPEDMVQKTEEYRTKLIEAVADFDEDLMMKYLDGGEEIRGIREGDGMVCAILCDGVIDCALGEASHGMRAAIDEIG